MFPINLCYKVDEKYTDICDDQALAVGHFLAMNVAIDLVLCYLM